MIPILNFKPVLHSNPNAQHCREIINMLMLTGYHTRTCPEIFARDIERFLEECPDYSNRTAAEYDSTNQVSYMTLRADWFGTWI